MQGTQIGDRKHHTHLEFGFPVNICLHWEITGKRIVLRCEFRWVTHAQIEGMACSCCRLRKLLQYRAKSSWEFIIRHPNACVRKTQAAERVFTVPCNNLPGCTCSWWQQHLGGHHHIPLPLPCCLAPPPAQQLGQESQQQPQPLPGVTPQGATLAGPPAPNPAHTFRTLWHLVPLLCQQGCGGRMHFRSSSCTGSSAARGLCTFPPHRARHSSACTPLPQGCHSHSQIFWQ